MAFKEVKILGILGLIFTLLMTVTIYFGIDNVVGLFNHFFLSGNTKIAYIFQNLLLIEQGPHWDVQQVYWRTIAGLIMSTMALIALMLTNYRTIKRMYIGGILFFLSGLGGMIILGTSALGWIAGPMLMIAGFLAVYNSKNLY